MQTRPAYEVTHDGNKNAITITERPINVLFTILWHNLSKFVIQMGLYCSKQLETTFNQFGKKSLHITFSVSCPSLSFIP